MRKMKIGSEEVRKFRKILSDVLAVTQHKWRVKANMSQSVSAIFQSSVTNIQRVIASYHPIYWHNVQMTGSEFVTLAEILKYLNINMLRKSVIGRNEAIPSKERKTRKKNKK